MKKLTKLAICLIFLLPLLAACENDTTSPRCNTILTFQNSTINDHQWQLICDPPFPPPASESGWANLSSTAGGAVPQTIYIWAHDESSDLILRKVTDHEIGHVIADERGLDKTLTPGSYLSGGLEWWVEGYAYCFDPLAGVSYFNYPTDCGNYL